MPELCRRPPTRHRPIRSRAWLSRRGLGGCILSPLRPICVLHHRRQALQSLRCPWAFGYGHDRCSRGGFFAPAHRCNGSTRLKAQLAVANVTCHIMPHHATSCHITPHHATSCHIMPHHATSCHMTRGSMPPLSKTCRCSRGGLQTRSCVADHDGEGKG